MESLSVSEFKATCLAVLEDISRQKKRIVITKRGKPIAEVIPFETDQKDVPLKDTVTYMGDIVTPVAEEDWEALK
jgi:prevent-host-death family protein